jgi:hypothetical protein
MVERREAIENIAGADPRRLGRKDSKRLRL